MKPKKKESKPSLLARLFGAKAKAKPAAKKAVPGKATPKPTPLDRSISEIKTMVRIGQNNPARLATILGNLIKAQQEKKAQEDEKFKKLVQDILARQQKEDPPPSP